MPYSPNDHTFAILAYQECAYLESCIRSIQQQTVLGHVIICTSTPNAYIGDLAEKYGIKVFENPLSTGIASDWNFAYQAADTELVTLAHQDDLYEPDYLRIMLLAVNDGKTPLIAFPDYYEIRDGKRVEADRFINLRVKQIMLAPLRSKALQSSVWVRRRILSLGNPIGCPSVLYVKSKLPVTLFRNGFSSNVDWQVWDELSKIKGRFLYVHQTLMGHRIHGEAATAKLINASGVRAAEDLAMFQRFWPKPVARLIARMYVHSQSQRPEQQKERTELHG